MKVDLQNRLFKYFTKILQALIAKAKKDGKFDLGILGTYVIYLQSQFSFAIQNIIWFLVENFYPIDLGSAGEDVKQVQTYSFLRKHTTGVAATQLHIVHAERGMTWEQAMEKYSELSGPCEGFYLTRPVCISQI